MKTRASLALALRVVVFELLIIGLLFGSAGRWDLPWFWILIATHTALMLFAVSRIDPDLRKERLRPVSSGEDPWFPRLAMPLLLAHLIVAGLDIGRFHWSEPPSLAVHISGLCLYASGLTLVYWSMIVNRFFSPAVRIQSERGHQTITTGPYRRVRHPGYAGTLLAGFASGVVLGSWWSLVPVACVAVLFLRRLLLEDRFLRQQLPDYDDYARSVRYRLIPGVW